MGFIACQYLRTEDSKSRIDELIDTSMKAVLEEDARFDREFLGNYRIKDDQSIHYALKSASAFALGLSDIKPLLLIAPERKQFITSDNPVFLYNQYCEDVKGIGVVGAFCGGLQVFLPLSPQISFILFDEKIYRTSPKNPSNHIFCSENDAILLNTFQVVNANKNLYFNIDYADDYLERIVCQAKKYRQKRRTLITKADGVHPEENSVLIHMRRQHPVLKPNFDFMRIKRNAKRIPLMERAQMYRKEIPIDESYDGEFRRGSKTREWKVRKQ
ncbi:DUF4238 domain-containing protein [Acidobacteriota bacterium]